jgi:cobalt transporter subunit CbtA
MPLSGREPLRRLLLAALGAGIAAGLLVAIAQQIWLAPLILQAEAIELGVQHVDSSAMRVMLTALFDGLGAFAFALMLAAGLSLRGVVSWKQGLLWGLCGYAAFALAPGISLPPELPGHEGAALLTRQTWWLGTAMSTATGLACVGLAARPRIRLSGGVLLLAPQIIGMSTMPGLWSLQGTALQFALGSLGVSLLMWIAIGSLTAALLVRAAAAEEGGGLASRAAARGAH